MLAALLKPLAALALAAAIIAVVLLALGASPIGVFAALAAGAFGNWLAFTDTLVKATPLVFTGLAVSLAFQGALWNIGADGQLVIGALMAGAVGPALGAWPRPLAIGLTLGAGALGGAIWGGVCGWLRARRNVNEVISTIMLNFVAAQVLSWAVHGPLMEPSRAYPTEYADRAELPSCICSCRRAGSTWGCCLRWRWRSRAARYCSAPRSVSSCARSGAIAARAPSSESRSRA